MGFPSDAALACVALAMGKTLLLTYVRELWA
jgi:hypothetical protein